MSMAAFKMMGTENHNILAPGKVNQAWCREQSHRHMASASCHTGAGAGTASCTGTFAGEKKKSEAHLNDSWTESNQHILPGSCTSHSADKAAVLVTSKATTNACKEKHCPWANSVLTHADAKWHRKKCLPLLISSGVIFTFPCYP